MRDGRGKRNYSLSEKVFLLLELQGRDHSFILLFDKGGCLRRGGDWGIIRKGNQVA